MCPQGSTTGFSGVGSPGEWRMKETWQERHEWSAVGSLERIERGGEGSR